MIAADWHPSRGKLIQFSALLIVAAFALAFVRGPSNAAFIVAAVGVFGVAWPGIAHPIFLVATAIALPIGWVVSHLLLRLIYYVVLTPIALLFRAFGRDPLQLRRRNADSYWHEFQQGRDIESYFRQS